MRRIYKSTDRHLPKEVRALFAEIISKKQFFISQGLRVLTRSVGPNDDMNIEGIANFARADRVRELVVPMAWRLENYLKVPVILRDHDHGMPVGTATEVKAKEDGLYYKGVIGRPSLAALTECQIETRSLLAQGVIKANSVGFLPFTAEYDDQDDVLRYTDAELLEITVCSVPMQQDSIITAVKSFKEKIVMPSKNEVTLDDVLGAVTGLGEKVAGMQKSLDTLVKERDDALTANKALTAKVTELEATVKKVGDEKTAIEKQTDELLTDMEKKGYFPEAPAAS